MPVFALSESCTNADPQANGQTNSYDDCQTDSDTDTPETNAGSLLSGCHANDISGVILLPGMIG